MCAPEPLCGSGQNHRRLHSWSPSSCPMLLSLHFLGFSWVHALHKLHASDPMLSFRDLNLRWRRKGKKINSIPEATATLYVGSQLLQSWTYMMWWFWPLGMRSKLLSPLASLCSTAAVRAWETKGMGARNEIQALSAAVQPGCGQTYKTRSN